MTRRQIGLVALVVGGVLLLLAAVPWGRLLPQPPPLPARAWPFQQDPATPAAPLLATPDATAIWPLRPEAATAAAFWPTPTPIATPGQPATRPSAPVRCAIPALGIDVPIVTVGWHVAQVGGEARGIWDTVAGAAGHHRGSADPGGPGNCVLSGHSSDEGGAIFARLNELAVGDRIELYTAAGERHIYRVTTTLTLDETGATVAEKREHARWLDATEAPVLTLVTCWPNWAYTHRIVIRAIPE